MITFKEMFTHTVYQITDDTLTETTVIDFGKYAIPKNMYDMNQFDAIEELNRKGWATIDKYLENEQFIYLMFWVWPNDESNENYSWLINKNTGNSVLQRFTTDNPQYEMMQEAKMLTADNKLVFIVDALMFKECTDSFFNMNDNIKNSISEDSNPLILRLQINNF